MKNIVKTLGLAGLIGLSSGCKKIEEKLTRLEIDNPQIVKISYGPVSEAVVEGNKNGTNYQFHCYSPNLFVGTVPVNMGTHMQGNLTRQEPFAEVILDSKSELEDRTVYNTPNYKGPREVVGKAMSIKVYLKNEKFLTLVN
jgi:hypothetical protein